MEWENDRENDEEYVIEPGGYFARWKEEKDDEFCDRECYEFNDRLPEDKDDRCCVHCSKYLTLNCPHIGEFIDDIDELDVD